MVDRHHARILAMQALCQLEVLDADFLSELDAFLSDENPPRAVQDYARALVEAARTDRAAIDAAIGAAAENWDVKRMAPVDRNMLRVAVCELRHRPEVPPRVVVTEAIEIGKSFGTAESGGFINGVLDAILRRGEAAGGETASCEAGVRPDRTQEQRGSRDANNNDIASH